MKTRHLLIVDGYNVLGATTFKRELLLEDAREQLIGKLADYAGYTDQCVIVVFDAWQSGRAQRSETQVGRVQVIYTKHGETADNYIERLCHDRSDEATHGALHMRVATSDYVEQTVIFGRGATRLSSRELIREMGQIKGEQRAEIKHTQAIKKHPLMERLPEALQKTLEDMRRGG